MNLRKAGLLAAALMIAIPGYALAAEAKKPEIRTDKLTNLQIERAYPEAFTTDELTFKLEPAKTPGWRFEYMVNMKAGDAMLYSLTATAPVITEFHGEFNDALVFYREGSDTTAAHGQLIAPADGKHGWYIANTTDKPVTVTLKLAGRYEKTPGLSVLKN